MRQMHADRSGSRNGPPKAARMRIPGQVGGCRTDCVNLFSRLWNSRLCGFASARPGHYTPPRPGEAVAALHTA